MGKIKIGGVIVSDMNHTNYGSVLQAYATVKSILGLGYDLSIIRYKKRRPFKEKVVLGFRYIMSGGFKRICRGFKTDLNMRFRKEYACGQIKRRTATNNFKEKELRPFFVEYEGYSALCAGSKDYDVIFVGSDQTWNPIGFYSNYWNLMFVDDSVPKFSYAASYGVSSVPRIQQKGTKAYLERIEMISVREIQGKKIVESLSNRTAKVVVDPTLLQTRAQWLEFAGQSNKVIDEPYVFCYFLGPRYDVRREALRLAKEKGLKIVTCPHMEEFRQADEGFGDYTLYDLTPYDFLRLLSKACYVCTDSFHGTVFSIIMHKRFMTFYREIGPSTNSRIDSLLASFCLQGRLFAGNIRRIDEEIDYNNVDEHLKMLREESIAFLKDALLMSKSRVRHD